MIRAEPELAGLGLPGRDAIGRRLEPDEIAPLAVYLASDASAAMTGQAINIDGGVLMTG